MTDKRKSQIMLYGALIVIIGLAALFANFGRPFIIRQVGITIGPGEGMENYAVPANLKYYRQDDPLWKAVPLAESELTIGSSGGLICCIATALNHMGIAADPLAVNDAFLQNDVFEGQGDVVWMNIKNAYPQVDYRYENSFSAADIDADLKAGLFPILRVKYKGTGVFHWLMVVGSQDGEYLVMDSLDESPVKLSNHGKVYAYRVLYVDKEV